MRSIFPLHNTPMNYAWGDHYAIANLQNRQPTQQPEAEVWFGVHPKSPAYLPDGTSLVSTLANQGTTLSYLVKLLAAAKPLSIQVHPNAQQARVGFAREQSLPAGNKNYTDNREKSEMLIAISETFSLLCGLRPEAELRVTLDYFATCAPRFKAMQILHREHGLKHAIAWLFQNAKPEDIAKICTHDMPYESQTATLRDLEQHYAPEPGFIMAILMNRFDITRGQCIFIEAGTLHSYLRGFGVEIMTNSDNVIRAGLTLKHIDTDQLQQVALFAPTNIPLLEPQIRNQGTTRRFVTPHFTVEEVTLAHTDTKLSTSPHAAHNTTTPAINTTCHGLPCHREPQGTTENHHTPQQNSDNTLTPPTHANSVLYQQASTQIPPTSQNNANTPLTTTQATTQAKHPTQYTLKGAALVLVTAGFAQICRSTEKVQVNAGFAAFTVGTTENALLSGCGVCYVVTDDPQFDITCS